MVNIAPLKHGFPWGWWWWWPMAFRKCWGWRMAAPFQTTTFRRLAHRRPVKGCQGSAFPSEESTLHLVLRLRGGVIEPSLAEPCRKCRKQPWSKHCTCHQIRLVGTFTGSQGSYMFLPFSAFFYDTFTRVHGQLKNGRISPRCLPESSTARRWFAASAMLASMFLGQMAGTWQVAGQPWVWVKRMDPKMTKCVCLLVNWFNWMV